MAKAATKKLAKKTAAKKKPAKKAAAKKTARKAVAKKATRKGAVKKSAAKKAVRRGAVKKSAGKKTAAKKTAAKRTGAKRTGTKRTATEKTVAKKTAAKRAPVKRKKAEPPVPPAPPSRRRTAIELRRLSTPDLKRPRLSGTPRETRPHPSVDGLRARRGFSLRPCVAPIGERASATQSRRSSWIVGSVQDPRGSEARSMRERGRGDGFALRGDPPRTARTSAMARSTTRDRAGGASNRFRPASALSNFPDALAMDERVGHMIGLRGDVAERLKAAVC